MGGALETKGGLLTVTARFPQGLVSVALLQCCLSMLRASWYRFNAATAKQAKRCKISAHLFG